MPDKSFNQVNTLVRIKESELLGNEVFNLLLLAQDEKEISAILHGTTYEEYVVQPGFLEDFETICNKERQKVYDWLYDITPNPALIHLYAARYTFHNLKVLTKAHIMEKDFDEMFISDGRYDIDTLKSAINTRQSNELEEPLLAAINEVLNYFNEGKLLQAIDYIYDREFLSYIHYLAKKADDESIYQSFQKFIDLSNISMMARGILQEQGQSFMASVLSDEGNLPKEDLLDYIRKGIDEFTQFLLNGRYSNDIRSIVDEKTQKLNFVALSKLTDDSLTSLYESADLQSFGPMPLMSFVSAKEVEWKNLRLLFVGKRNKFSNEEMAERIRKL